MQTPTGQECPHYYEDFNRGRSTQECRLVKVNPASQRWRPKDCARCPVPDILRANASPDMKLSLTIRSLAFGLVRRLDVTATCTRHNIPIANPYVGCPLDTDRNDVLKLFRDALDE